MKRKIYDALIILALILTLAAIVVFPKETVAAGKDGVTLCMDVIVPSMLPFFVLSVMTVELGFAAQLGKLAAPIMRKLFNVSGACATAFILGFIGGYPVGAQTAISLYKSKQCNRIETERLLSFCNNSGPAFILGVVGAGIFSSGQIGIELYLVHALSSVIIGVLFRFYKKSSEFRVQSSELSATRSRLHNNENVRDNSEFRTLNSELTRPSFAKTFTGAVVTAAQTSLNICGFVIFFTVFIKLLFLTGALPAIAEWAARTIGVRKSSVQDVLTGIIELTSGVRTLNSALRGQGASLKMAAFMLGWAGLSVHCQALSFICDSGLSAKTYIAGKFLHGILSTLLMTLLFEFIPFNVTAAAYLTEQVAGISSLGFTRALTLSTATAAVMFVLCGAAAMMRRRRNMR